MNEAERKLEAALRLLVKNHKKHSIEIACSEEELASISISLRTFADFLASLPEDFKQDPPPDENSRHWVDGVIAMAKIMENFLRTMADGIDPDK